MLPCTTVLALVPLIARPLPELLTRMPVIKVLAVEVSRMASPLKLLKAMSRITLPLAPESSKRPFVTLELPESTMLCDVPRKFTGRLTESCCVSVMLAATRIS